MWLFRSYGWRQAFIGLGGIWSIAVFPLLFLFFRGAQDKGRKASAQPKNPAVNLPGLTLKEALCTLALYRLLFATLVFTFSIFGIVVNFVPILTDSGTPPMTAASAASMIGIFLLIGRLCTGAILDRLPAHIVGAVCFLILVPACLLLIADDASIDSYFAAAAFVGLMLGAEINVFAYMATRHFGLKNFGAVQGALLGATALGATLGPLGAAATYDYFGSYSHFLTMTIAFMFANALVIGTGGADTKQAKPHTKADDRTS